MGTSGFVDEVANKSVVDTPEKVANIVVVRMKRFKILPFPNRIL